MPVKRPPIVCRWCDRRALPGTRSARLCPGCQDRVDHVVREALGRQRRGSLPDSVMAREFGFSSDNWARIRRDATRDPTARVATALVDPGHRPPGRGGESSSGSWVHRAACRGHKAPDVFFPTSRHDEEVSGALALCRACPVTGECKRRRGSEGVWGGRLYTAP